MSDIATALQNLSAAIDALSARVQTCFDTAYHRGANMPQQRSTSTLSAVISSDLIAQEIFTGQANSNHQLVWYNQDGSRPQDGHVDVELYKGCQSINFSDPAITQQSQFRRLLQGCKGIRDVVMPDVINLSVNNFLNNTFSNSSIRSFKAPKLQTIGSGTISLTGCQNLEEINLSSLRSPPGSYALLDAMDCTSLKTANFHNMLCAYTLANMFEGCTSLSSVDFSSLRYFKIDSYTGGNLRYMFKGCTSLSSVSFPNLDNSSTQGQAHLYYAIGMFEGCTSLSSVEWPYLRSIVNASSSYPVLSGTFKDCPLMTTVRFPSLLGFNWNSGVTAPPVQSWNYTEKIYFNNLYSIGNAQHPTIFVDMPALRELHFPAKNRQNIEASPGFPTQWGLNGQVTIYFDL